MLSTSLPFFSSNSPKSDNPITFNVKNDFDFNSLISNGQENDAFVYWYFGGRGLKQAAIDFYRPGLTQNILKGATPFIVDLTAWGAFQKLCPINKFHESAKSLDGEKVKTLVCSQFFENLQQIKPEDAAYELLTDIVKRENLLSPSLGFKEVGLSLGTLFKNNCPSLQSIYSLDCAKSYSVIQYIEFLFLVEMILMKKPDVSSIKFILPNDEAKYYLSSMAKDLQQFLAARGHKVGPLNIEVQCFKYGEQLSHRPYNAPSETISSKKKLNLAKIIDESLLNAELAGKAPKPSF